MPEEEVAEALHLGQPLPAQRLDPPFDEGQHADARLVRPEAIERKSSRSPVW
jgi:hypothetical protein